MNRRMQIFVKISALRHRAPDHAVDSGLHRMYRRRSMQQVCAYRTIIQRARHSCRCLQVRCEKKALVDGESREAAPILPGFSQKE